MNILTIIGIVLAGGTLIMDRFIRPLPDGAAIVLYMIAGSLISAGMIAGRQKKKGDGRFLSAGMPSDREL